MDKQVVISIRTVLFAFLMLLGGYVIYRLGTIFGILIISSLIVVSVEPLIKYIMRLTVFNKPISRGVAVILTYFLLLVILAALGTTVVPPVVVQAQKLLKNFSSLAQELNLTDSVDFKLPDLLPSASKISGDVLSITVVVFSNLTMIFSIFIISLYMSMDWDNLKKRFAGLFSEKYKDMVIDIINDIEENVGHWIKGQFLLMFIIGFFSFLSLVILDVEYALALGIIAGFLEFIPMIGPIISAILAAVVGFSDSALKGFGVVILFIVIQQLEGNIIVPQVMQKVSGFSPLVVLLAILIGSEFFGVLGALLAIPITMIGLIVIRRVLAYKA